ncbi:MAG: hypothetical protein IPG45_36430 [Deltaproteobacteria bacterium]|nr:hypothetical protein [Deltaproteobacteria bacterium]
MKKLKLFFLAASLALTSACGGVEGDDAEAPDLQIEVHQSAIIDDDPLVHETVDRCLNEGRPCHVFAWQGGVQRCFSGKIICASASVRFPHCDALGISGAYEQGRCVPRGTEPHVPGGHSPR